MKQLSSLALPLAVASVFIFLLFFVFNLNLFNVNTFVWSALAFLIFASYTAFFLFLRIVLSRLRYPVCMERIR